MIIFTFKIKMSKIKGKYPTSEGGGVFWLIITVYDGTNKSILSLLFGYHHRVNSGGKKKLTSISK